MNSIDIKEPRKSSRERERGPRTRELPSVLKIYECRDICHDIRAQPAVTSQKLESVSDMI